MPDMEMIDRVEVVIEAGLRDLLGAQPAAVLQPTVDKKNSEAGLCEIASQNQTMVSRTDDYSVVASFQGAWHRILQF
jgi:hypothetical protein